MFDGKTYGPSDGPRLGVQLAQVASLMRDGQWRTLYEIARATGCPPQSASARLRDLRKPRFGGHTVERQRCQVGVFLYRAKAQA